MIMMILQTCSTETKMTKKPPPYSAQQPTNLNKKMFDGARRPEVASWRLERVRRMLLVKISPMIAVSFGVLALSSYPVHFRVAQHCQNQSNLRQKPFINQRSLLKGRLAYLDKYRFPVAKTLWLDIVLGFPISLSASFQDHYYRSYGCLRYVRQRNFLTTDI